jgi:adhesin/invasin
MTRPAVRSFLSVLLSICMLLAHVPAFAASHPESAETDLFLDVPEFHPDRDYIHFLAERDFIGGYPDGTFGPDDPLTRGAAAKIAVHVAGFEPVFVGDPLPFSDLSDDHWAAPYVRTAIAQGIAQGFDDQTFRPGDGVTRAQLAAMAVRAIRQPASRAPVLDLKDVAPGDWFYLPALFAVASGMMQVPDDEFRPHDIATRAEAARAFATAYTFTSAALDVDLPVMVEAQIGTVEIAMPDSEEFVEISGPTQLPVGGRIRTAAASVAVINFPDGSGLYLDALSELIVHKSRGAAIIGGIGVEDLDVELVSGQVYGALVPRLSPEELQAFHRFLSSSPEARRRDSLAAAAVQRILAGGHIPPGDNVPPEASRILIFSDPASLEPGDKEGAQLTIVLVDDAGQPVTVTAGPVTLRLLSDVGTFSNANPVIPAGFQAVEVTLFPPAKEPDDAKTRVTAVVGDLSAALTIPTSKTAWYQTLFSKKTRAKVRMPWAVASVRGSYISVNVDAEENGLSVLGGEATIRSLSGDEEILQDNQSSQVYSPEEPPSNPAPLRVQEQQQWNAQRTWVAEQKQRIEERAPTSVRSEVVSEHDRVAGLISLLPADTVPPSVVISVPEPNAFVGTSTVVVRGVATDNVKLSAVTVNGAPARVDAAGNWQATVALQPGANAITAVATDGAGNRSATSVSVQFDSALPSLQISAPAVTRERTARITGTVRAPAGIRTLTINDRQVQTGPDGTFTVTADLEPGRNLITAVLTDTLERTARQSLEIVSAPLAPILEIDDGPTLVATEQYTLTGKAVAQYARLRSLTVNGRTALTTADGDFRVSITLRPGANVITVEATDSAGNVTTELRALTLDLNAPSVRITQPRSGLITREQTITVTGVVTATAGIRSFTVNGTPVTPLADGNFTTSVALQPGQNRITAVATDLLDRTATDTHTVTLSVTPPTLILAHPPDGHRAGRQQLNLSGSAASAFGPIPSVTVNGRSMVVGSDGSFASTIPLAVGENQITAEARDSAGNVTRLSRTVIYNPQQPTLNVVSPVDGLITAQAEVIVQGLVENRGDVTQVTVNGVPAAVAADGSFRAATRLSPGRNGITVTLPAAAGGAGITRTVIYSHRAPTLLVRTPVNDLVTAHPEILVSGTALTSYGTPALVSVNGLVTRSESSGSFTFTISLHPGTSLVTVRAVDAAGLETVETRRVTYRPAVPLIHITEPANNSITLSARATVRGVVSSTIGLKLLQVNGATVPVDSTGQFTATVDLQPGTNTVTVVAEDDLGGVSASSVTITRAGQPPLIRISSPPDNYLTGDSSLTVSGTAESPSGAIRSVRVNGSGAMLGADGSWTARINLVAGENSIQVVAEDTMGQTATATRRVTFADGTPTLDVTAPRDGIVVTSPAVTVTGRVTASAEIVRLTINNTAVTPGADGHFSGVVQLRTGTNLVTVTVTDALNRTSTVTRTVVVSDRPPAISLSQPLDGLIARTASVSVSGTVTVVEGVHLTSFTVNGTPVTVGTNGSFSTAVPLLVVGENRVVVSATDSAGSTATATRTVTWAPEALEIAITSPAGGTRVTTERVTVTGSVAGFFGTPRVTVNGTVATVSGTGTYSVTLPIVRGENSILAEVTDERGRTASTRGTVVFDPAHPTILIASPTSGTTFTTPTVSVTGTATSQYGDLVVTVGDQTFSLGTGGSFAGTVVLTSFGPTAITVRAKDKYSEASVSTDVTFAPPQPSPATTTIQVAPNSMTANGTSTAIVTVQLKEANGTNMTSSTGHTVTLSATLGAQILSVTNNGDGTYTATFRAGTTAGTAVIGGTVNGQPLAHTASVTLLPGPASASASIITGPASTVTADGTSPATFTVQIRDANGNNVATGGHTVAVGRSPIEGTTLSALTDHGNGTYTAQITSTVAGTVQVFGTLAGEPIGGTATISFTAGGPSLVYSTVTADPPAVRADGVSTVRITVALRDGHGNLITTGTHDLTVTANDLPMTVTRTESGTYTTLLPATAVHGSVLVVALLNGQPLGTVTVLFTSYDPTAGSPDTSTIAAASASLTADGTSTTTVTVQLKDAFGNNLSTSERDTLTLSATLGAEILNLVNNQNGTFAATFKAGTTAGIAVITGTLNGHAMLHEAIVTLQPGAPSASASTITVPSTAIAADGTTAAIITVTIRDAHFNALTTGGHAVALSRTPLTGTTLSAVTDRGDGTYSAQLTSTIAGSVDLSGTLAGQTIGSGPVTVVFAAGAPSVSLSTLSVEPLTVKADGSSTATATVTLRDSFGNQITTGTYDVTVTANHQSLSVTKNGDGTYSATVPATTTPSSVEVAAFLNSQQIGTAAVTFTPVLDDPLLASAATSTLTVASSSLTANGTSTTTVTVQLKDAFNNNLTVGGATLVLEVVESSSGAVIQNLTDLQNGTYTATLRAGTVAMPVTIRGTLNGVPMTATFTVNLTAGSPSHLTSTISLSAVSLPADGTSAATITVELKDVNGNLVTTGGHGVTISRTPTEGTTLSSVTDHNNGTYTAQLTATAATLVQISATVGGQTLTSAASVTFSAGAPSVQTSTVTVEPIELRADGTTTGVIIVTLRDSFGNLVTTGTHSVTVTAGVSSLTVTNNGDGTYTATLPAMSIPGTVRVTASLGGTEIGFVDVTFTAVLDDPTRASAATSTITAATSTLTANGTSTTTITVRLKDELGNNLTVGGAQLSLAVAETASLATILDLTDNQDGTYTATLKAGTVAMPITIQGRLGAAQTLMSNTAAVTLIAGPASHIGTTITVNPSSLSADGTSTATISVQLRDAHGNLVTSTSGASVSLSISPAIGTILAPAQAGPNGTFTTTLRAGTVAGTAVISGTLSVTGLLTNASIQNPATVQFTPGNISATQSDVSRDVGTIAVDSDLTSTITVQLKDANGNNVSGTNATVVLSASRGLLSTVTSDGNGLYTAHLSVDPQRPEPGTATITARVIVSDGGTTTEFSLTRSVSVSFTEGAPDPLTTTITANPTLLEADGESLSTITVRLKDKFGNNVTTAGPGVTLSVSPTGMGSISTPEYAGSGTYTAEYTAALTHGTVEIRGTLGTNDIASVATLTLLEVVQATASPLTTTLSASQTSIVADGVTTSAITVQLKDDQGNALPTNPGGVIVFTEDGFGSITSQTDNGDGTLTAVLRSETIVGTARVRARISGVATTNYVDVVFVAGPPSAADSIISATDRTLVADGESFTTITLEVYDVNGNPVADQVNIDLRTTKGTLEGPFLAGDGVYSFQLTAPTQVGFATIFGTLCPVSQTTCTEAIGTTDTVEFVTGAPSIQVSELSIIGETPTVGSTNPVVITVELYDAFGNFVSGGNYTVTLSASPANLGTLTATATRLSSGEFVGTFTPGTTAGMAIIAATVEGIGQLTETATITILADNPSAEHSTITASAEELVAGTGTATVTLQLKDAHGNNATADFAEVSLDVDPPEGGTVTNLTHMGNGQFTALFTAGTVAGVVTVTGTVKGSQIVDEAVIDIIPDNVSAVTSTVEVSETTLIADGTSTTAIMITLKDHHGNARRGTLDTVVVDRSPSLGDLGSVVALGDGVYSSSFQAGLTVGDVTITVTANGVALPSVTISLVPIPSESGPSATTSTLTASSTSMTVDGSVLVTMQLRDADGNNLTTEFTGISFTTNLGSLAPAAYIGNGQYVTTLTSAVTGNATVRGVINGVNTNANVRISIAVGAPDPTLTTLTATATQITTDQTSTITINLFDQYGNAVTAGGHTITLQTTLGTVSDVTYKQSKYTATFSSAALGTALISGTLNGQAITHELAIGVTVGGASASTSTLTQTSESIVVGGLETADAVVTLFDAAGNRIQEPASSLGWSWSTQKDGRVENIRWDDEAKVHKATVIAGTAAGDIDVSAKLGNRTIGTVKFFIVASTPDVSKSTVKSSAGNKGITADGVSSTTITVQLLDSYGNLVTDQYNVRIHTTPTEGVSLTPVAFSNGTYSSVLTSTVAGTALVTADVELVPNSGVYVPLTASVQVKMTAPRK